MIDERLIRHDLGHLYTDDKWGHLAEPLEVLLDCKDDEITRLREALVNAVFALEATSLLGDAKSAREALRTTATPK